MSPNIAVRRWLLRHLPRWAWPVSPYGERGRADMPERHAVVNELTVLRLRIDRLQQLQAKARLQGWREQHHG